MENTARNSVMTVSRVQMLTVRFSQTLLARKLFYRTPILVFTKIRQMVELPILGQGQTDGHGLRI